MEELYIKCHQCKTGFYQYIYSPDTVRAISGSWKTLENSESLLDEPPKVGEHYLVTFQSALKMRIDQPFWIVYQDTYSTKYNAIGTEENIQTIVFCKCEFVRIFTQEEYTATIELNITEVKNLTDIDVEYKPEIQWWWLFKSEVDFKESGNTENFKNYSLINISTQGDVGIDLIIYKENGLSRIVAVRDWDYHWNEWNLCRISLTNEQEVFYGIKHSAE